MYLTILFRTLRQRIKKSMSGHHSYKYLVPILSLAKLSGVVPRQMFVYYSTHHMVFGDNEYLKTL